MLFGGISEESIALYLTANGWHGIQYDEENDAVYCTTDRDDRTDEEIDLAARSTRVYLSITLSVLVGHGVAPKFRYRIIEDGEKSMGRDTSECL